MFSDKKVVIWDLDNTLYRITPEFADRLDLAMAEALVLDLGVDMSVEDCKDLVKQFQNASAEALLSVYSRQRFRQLLFHGKAEKIRRRSVRILRLQFLAGYGIMLKTMQNCIPYGKTPVFPKNIKDV